MLTIEANELSKEVDSLVNRLVDTFERSIRIAAKKGEMCVYYAIGEHDIIPNNVFVKIKDLGYILSFFDHGSEKTLGMEIRWGHGSCVTNSI